MPPFFPAPPQTYSTEQAKVEVLDWLSPLGTKYPSGVGLEHFPASILNSSVLLSRSHPAEDLTGPGYLVRLTFPMAHY